MERAFTLLQIRPPPPLPVIGVPACVIRCPACVIRCPACVIRCPACVIRCPACVIRCPACVIRCPACVIRCPACVIHCSACVNSLQRFDVLKQNNSLSVMFCRIFLFYFTCNLFIRHCQWFEINPSRPTKTYKNNNINIVYSVYNSSYDPNMNVDARSVSWGVTQSCGLSVHVIINVFTHPRQQHA